MADKNLYANDLIHRFPSHTFTETTVESETKVEFKNASSVVIKTSQNLDVIDAYRNIIGNFRSTHLHQTEINQGKGD